MTFHEDEVNEEVNNQLIVSNDENMQVEAVVDQDTGDFVEDFEAPPSPKKGKSAKKEKRVKKEKKVDQKTEVAGKDCEVSTSSCKKKRKKDTKKEEDVNQEAEKIENENISKYEVFHSNYFMNFFRVIY